MILNTRDLHIVPFGNCEFCENRCRERHNLLREVDIDIRTLYIYGPILVKCGISANRSVGTYWVVEIGLVETNFSIAT